MNLYSYLKRIACLAWKMKRQLDKGKASVNTDRCFPKKLLADKFYCVQSNSGLNA